MNLCLLDTISTVPDSDFWRGDTPNYNHIFVVVAKKIYGRSLFPHEMRIEDFTNGTLPNLSSFQRAVAKDARRRRRRRSLPRAA